MHTIYPKSLQAGDTVMVIASSSPSVYISQNVHDIARKRFAELGLNVVFAPNFNSPDAIGTPDSIAGRVADIHAAFSDKNIAGIFTILGGHHANQLLEHIDFELIKCNPKVFCGFSDITALNNAILARTGLITFCGPHYSSFGMLRGFDFTMDSFRRAAMSDAMEFDIDVSDEWSDDPWYRDQDARTFIKNSGARIMNAGVAHGTLIGGNLSTLALLQGTKYMPDDFEDIILFVEDDEASDQDTTIRQLQGILMQDFAHKVRGILIGRFQKLHNIDPVAVYQPIKNHFTHIPVIADLDFGHTTPLLTIPVGANCELNATDNAFNIKISKQDVL